ncbi:thiamine-phosphate kinase [Methanoculleus sp.]|uniref:thiamine-phosphate kinase n=1 Tax=Methanoculleus sp. TaxID=90427 RepID=UPI0025FFED35|nr:thiamine-phosphate kinase [Methanoculleus sp.]MCK9319126.1 thiamine-phosphate kinase [Methanoculleus sp.]MDD2254292.1 thiamine-phosphate kinase [Methanoculleus sp.]MDD2786802.1 thiamine-phosphate kinase [Methanoculleus sp.]MDD3216552.1 thiamine-phosphate kinase [Methanoculleus sp.]MDD4314404.1 thiamine-phosphate kinase [Methanoculleus sp.]
MDERGLHRLIGTIIDPERLEDDCAVISCGDLLMVATTDMLHETTDFPAGMTDWQAGWMSTAVTLSDVASMGAAPGQVLLAVGLDRPERLRGIMEGARDCCTAFGAELVGGDLDAHRELTIVSTGLGAVAPQHLVRRRGARPGDVIAVTGTLGEAQAALSGYDRHLKELLEPQPRVREGQALARAGVSAMMDISDGLALSLYDLLSVNDCGFAVDSARLPLPAGVPEDEGRELALYGGGDFELLFTAPPGILPVPGVEARVIGEVIVEQTVLVDGRPLERRGYLHEWTG